MNKNFSNIIISILILLTPFVFWTLTPSSFITAKQFLIFTITAVAGIAYSISIIKTKKLHFRLTSLSFATILFGLSIVASLVVNSEGRIEAIVSKGALLISLAVLSLLLQSTSSSIPTKLVSLLITTSSLLAITSLLGLTLFPRLPFLPSFLQSKTFTPTGDYLTTLIFILVGLACSFAKLKTGTNSSKPLYLASSVILIIAVVAIASLMIPGSPLAILYIPYKETWSIMLDAFKSMRSLFFGVGLSNYSALFTAVKPLSLNAGNLWNVIPQNGTSELLTLFTTAGVLGGFSALWLFIQSLFTHKDSPLYLPIMITILAIIATPSSTVIYTLFFLLISAGLTEGDHEGVTLKSKPALILGSSLILVFIVPYGYLLRPIISEYFIAKAQKALASNDGKAVYDAHIAAIRFTPKMTAYHLSYAEVNLNLASALSQKSGLSDEDKNTVAQLIQQAVREGKTAVSLRPASSAGWITLAKIYRNLINVAQGAETFTINNYAQAVALDPGNPILRVEFGGVFYQLGLATKDPQVQANYFGRAQTEFQTAIQLRNNYPNAYYNLAKLLESTKDYNNAALAMQKAISLLGSENPDLAKAQSELDTLKAKLPKSAPLPSPSPAGDIQSDEIISAPSPLPSPLPGGPIDL